MTVSVGIPAPPSLSPTSVPLAPQIVWPSLARSGGQQPVSWRSADLDAFPDAQVIRERRNRGEAVTHLPMFKNHVTNAAYRILIVDTYLLCGGERAENEVLSWFPDTLQAYEVKIACGGLRQGRDVPRFIAQLRDRETEINKRKASSGVPFTSIRLKRTLDPSVTPFVHDRFALVDDELWHFGATVGGLHHGVNAATRGWSVAATGAVRFFGQVWNQPGPSGGGRSACDSGRR